MPWLVAFTWVWRPVRHAHGQDLDRVDWSDRPPLAHHTRRTAPATEDLILALRRELKESSASGEYGDAAIQRELRERRFTPLFSLRTIARILERRGALDGRRRQRHQPPPPGWYLPDVAQARSELDSFDIVEGLVIEGGVEVEVLNRISLHGGLIASWPDGPITARRAADALVEHWRAFGLPAYAQFDNDTRFQGAHQYPDTIGRVSRLCLSLNITPVFAPPRETGFQAAVENLNGRWQAKVWARFHHDSLAALQAQSARYVAACRQRAILRMEGAPSRRPFLPPGRPTHRHLLAGEWFFCAGRRSRATCTSWDVLCWLMRTGRTAWFEPRSIWTRIGFSSTPSGGKNRPRNLCCGPGTTMCLGSLSKVDALRGRQAFGRH